MKPFLAQVKALKRDNDDLKETAEKLLDQPECLKGKLTSSLAVEPRTVEHGIQFLSDKYNDFVTTNKKTWDKIKF